MTKTEGPPSQHKAQGKDTKVYFTYLVQLTEELMAR
jgi:hypothetical protein